MNLSKHLKSLAFLLVAACESDQRVLDVKPSTSGLSADDLDGAWSGDGFELTAGACEGDSSMSDSKKQNIVVKCNKKDERTLGLDLGLSSNSSEVEIDLSGDQPKITNKSELQVGVANMKVEQVSFRKNDNDLDIELSGFAEIDGVTCPLKVSIEKLTKSGGTSKVTEDPKTKPDEKKPTDKPTKPEPKKDLGFEGNFSCNIDLKATCSNGQPVTSTNKGRLVLTPNASGFSYETADCGQFKFKTSNDTSATLDSAGKSCLLQADGTSFNLKYTSGTASLKNNGKDFSSNLTVKISRVGSAATCTGTTKVTCTRLAQ